MPNITLGVHRGGASGVSHSPPKVKSTEQEVAYNPFWLDLSQEPTPLNPEWRMKGIVINWLLKESPMGLWSQLIIGFEATNLNAIKAFMEKFFPNIRMSDDDLRKFLMLGHPTLASHIRGNTVLSQVVGGAAQKEAFIIGNYSGVLGGELHHSRGFFRSTRRWKINYNSGRYGDQHILSQADKNLAKQTVKLLFKRYTGSEVTD